MGLAHSQKALANHPLKIRWSSTLSLRHSGKPGRQLARQAIADMTGEPLDIQSFDVLRTVAAQVFIT